MTKKLTSPRFLYTYKDVQIHLHKAYYSSTDVYSNRFHTENQQSPPKVQDHFMNPLNL